jgi:GT2 family glycosyltransferase
MAGERLTVIISTHRGVESLERCLRALSEEGLDPEQLVVLDGGSTARNAAAYAADGEVLVFIDGDAIVRPGWAGALRQAFADGAPVAAGAISSAGPQGLIGGYESRWRRHDEHGCNGFLPFASGAHLAIRRDVFLQLGGFDESSQLTADVDLSLRAQLAGYPIVFVPAAELVYEPSLSLGGLLKERMRRARSDRMTERRFRRFPFMRLEHSGSATRAFTSSAAALLTAGTDGDDRRLSRPLLGAGIAAAARLGTMATDLRLAMGLAPMPLAVDYRDPEQHNTSSPLPGPPAFLLLGDDLPVMALLRVACEEGGELTTAPPGLEDEAMAFWDQPAPWSMRLVRTAVRAGWRLPLETAAMRVEREQPRTWGEAFLTLHRVHAWAHGRPRFGLAAAGSGGVQLAQRLPGVPIVVAGKGEPSPERVVARVTRRRLLRDRRAVAAELRQVIGR